MLIKLGAVAIVIALIAGALFFWKPWQKVNLPFINSESKKEISIVKPKPDLGRARQLIIDPSKDSVMQIMTQENVRVTLEIPKGALKEKTTIKLIPFYPDKNAQAPTQGVIVSPASLSFSEPVTLSFNFAESSVKNKAPKNIKTISIRTSGTSQVMQIDSNATSLTPALVARGVETENYLPARILTGGAYVFSLDGNLKSEVSKKALNAEKVNTLTIIESATALLFTNQKLSNDELHKSKKAVAKILSQKSPPPLELFAALVLQKKIKDNSFAWIPEAFAYETGEGFYQAACKTEGLSVEQYLGYAQSAQLLGHDGIGESCLNKAKNVVAEQAKKVLANPESDIKSLLIALQDVQILGMDDETNLDEQLMEKAKEKVVEEAKKVSDNPNSSATEAAIALQKMQALGVDEGPTHDALSQKVTEAVEKYEEPKEDPYDVEPTIDEEEILENAAMSALGIAMLQAFGFDQLDEESLKKKVDELSEGTKALHEAAYIMCAELGDEDCMSKLSDLEPQIAEAEREGYRVAEQIGELQSREYEDPEYLEENGDVTLYFEPSPTPGTQGEYEAYTDEYDESQNESDSQEAGYDLYESGVSYEDEEYSQESEQETESYESNVDYSESEE
jgi:hypothetical protein